MCNLNNLIVAFNMILKFTEVTLNSSIFVVDIFGTNPARKFGIIGFTHEVSFGLLQYDFVSEINR